MVGRWKDGSSLARYPYESGTLVRAAEHPAARIAGGSAARAQAIPSPAAPALRAQQTAVRAAHAVEAETAPVPLPVDPDNDFLFGEEDPEGLRCPFGAHIRRVNPHESFDPGSKEQLDITNRHRILRVGRFYVPKEGRKKGLVFMCLNGDLERQFEFVQQTWVQSPTFHGLPGECDPLVGSTCPAGVFTIPTRNGPVRLKGLPSFVRTRGGGYFFVPGRRLLEYLAMSPS